jgi:nicotinic acid mononucleotide adenylyltransferase
MSVRAFSGISEVDVLPWELEIAASQPSRPTTTWEVLDSIQPRLHGAQVAWVIGGDQLLGLDRWNRFPEVLGRCHWIILLRKGAEMSEESVLRKLAEWEASGLLLRDSKSQAAWIVSDTFTGGRPIRMEIVATDAQELSSTQIREEAARTGDLQSAVTRGWIDPKVAQYLKEKNLYGTRKHDL